jgi:Na+/H+-dicarboxylate symporter
MQLQSGCDRWSIISFPLSLVPFVGLFIGRPIADSNIISQIDPRGTITLAMFYLMAPVLSMVVAICSLRQLKRRSGKGFWLAIASMVISLTSLVLFLVVALLAFAITPGLWRGVF